MNCELFFKVLLLAVNDAHQPLAFCWFTSIHKMKIQFSWEKKKVRIKLCSNNLFAFTNQQAFSSRCMKTRKRIACANCLGKKATLHESEKKQKNDFDDMDQNSSQVKVARGGIDFLHRFGCKKEVASRDRNSCLELTKSNAIVWETILGKILCTSN